MKDIVIVGGGVVAWWSAVFLKNTVPGINVTILNTQVDDSHAEVAEPEFGYLLNLIGLSDHKIIQHSDGHYHGAQSFFNWPEDGENYFHSTEIPDLAHDAIDFNQWLLILKQAGSLEKVDDYLLRSVAARSGKLIFTANSNKAGGALSFDVAIFLNLLRAYGKKLNVNIVDYDVKKTNLDSQGYIESILLTNDLTLAADFFIDASGRKGSLIESALQIDYESWSTALPCNRKRSFISKPRSERLIPFTSVQLTNLGWIKNIPLRSKVISEYIYSDSFSQSDIFADATVGLFGDCKEFAFNPGMREKCWDKNCLALGEAAVVADYFSHSSLYLAAASLKRFVDYWPGNSTLGSVEREYNRLMRLEFETIRDFHCLHYVLAQKVNSPFGRLLENIQLPEFLQYRINLFEACGRTVEEESTLIHPTQWTSLCLGFGLWPQTYDYTATHENIDQYKNYAQMIKTKIQREIERSPDYTSYIQTLVTSI